MMGSTHFYLEYLMAIQNLLVQCFHNPAIFAIEYSLAPGAQYPKQSEEVLNGYLHALSVAKSNDRVCVMGDSAGGSLGLNMLADLRKPGRVSFAGETPAYMVLVSPWLTLASDSHRDTADDYLSAESLHKFANLYAPDKTGRGIMEIASPSVVLRSGWKLQGPKHGYYIWFGEKELLAQDIRSTMQTPKKLGAKVYLDERQSGGRNVHVWPLISFYLASDQDRRLEETRGIVARIARVFLE
ncbi:alpha/beta hydrolase fold domain-containing protein [Candidatus Bathyarchaeota archaeon]|nr:alpha/beta hydrolase fold domain-containing protein [Candidatus Bathyarchaeota archaeon]